MAAYKRTNTKIYSKPGPVVTPDIIYWKKFSAPVLLKEFGPIDYINFSPVKPYYFAVTCSVKVQVYNPITKQVYKNLSRFSEAAYGASFRSDGQLVCVGAEETLIRLFDVKNKTLLRVFNGHKGAVHRCFFTCDNTHIASFSDDKSVMVWDIPTEKSLITFTEHKDYVRAGTVSPISPDIVLSGGYDNVVCMYDTRMNTVALKVNHGAPVESVVFLPSGGIFLSAGGTEICVWDAFAGGRLLAKLTHHHKTVTCLHLTSDNRRIMSGSLDRHVKIYDVATYKVVHSLDYPNGILSLGISHNDETLAVGMVDGLISISQRNKNQISEEKESKTSRKYGHTPVLNVDIPVDEVITVEKKDFLERYDHSLRKFEYSRALDHVLRHFVVKKSPAMTVACFRELIKRKGLESALAGREGKSLHDLLKFFIKYLCDYRFTEILIYVAQVFLDVYEDSTVFINDFEANTLLKVVAERVQEQVALVEMLGSLQGALTMLLSAASGGGNSVPTPEAITPSEDAQKTAVIDVR